ncbi:hypothetical protein XENTR_v10008263 [Xenopus tropicalis]|nr:hypothetical protein XENTR_v10008263 [Xenopus tropicalis]
MGEESRRTDCEGSLSAQAPAPGTGVSSLSATPSGNVSSSQGESDQKRPRVDPKGLNPLQISNYTFHSMIGVGGYGKVMLASLKDRRSNVAVKIPYFNVFPFVCVFLPRHGVCQRETLKNQLDRHGALDITRVELVTHVGMW